MADRRIITTAKPLGDGRWLCVERMIFHWDLVVCDPAWVLDRWSYETAVATRQAWMEWDGTGDAPGPWTRHVGTRRRRLHGDPATEEVRP